LVAFGVVNPPVIYEKGDLLDMGKLRYHRIIIMTDADVDGAHIRTLLLTLFYRYFPDVIKNGHLYIAQPPLYRVQVGKSFQYAFSDDEKTEVLKELLAEAGEKKAARAVAKGKAKAEPAAEAADAEAEAGEAEGGVAENGARYAIQRYKGLGEMNPEQLWETTMDPENRVMLKVMAEDAERASEIFQTLMGDEVAPRKRFITAHAKLVRNLDI
jgi:DNA gyrase subunit B